MDRRNILIVDDVAALAEGLGTIIDRMNIGHRILCSSTPQDALDCIAHLESLDAAFLDIVIDPEEKTSGFDLLEAIKQRHPHCQIYIVSGATSEENRSKAKRLGAAGFIPKPFEPQEIIKLLNKAMN